MTKYTRTNKEDHRQIVALDHLINFSEETQDICSRWERDFAFFLMFFKQRISEEGYMKYKNMTPQQVDEACEAVAQHERDLENDVHDGYRTISVWHDWSERDLITMIKAFAELDSDDRSAILSIRTFLER